nr:glycerophosphoryl diester phosphodiesterase membrane domain-containing protein [Microbacterium immunditiarum]
MHPLAFGTILGKSFAALRQNPRVLLGFALCVQTGAYLLLLVAIGAIAFASFSRLDTVRPGTDEYEAIAAGSTAITLVAGVVLALAVGVLSVIVQGIVVSEVAHAAVAEKLTLGALWRRVRPVVWRLIGYTLLLLLITVVAIALVGGVLFAIGVASPPAAAALIVLVVLGAIPLGLWLSTKLLLAPAAIILEKAAVFGAIARSWTLIRGRFWPALGVIVLISLVFGVVGQVVGIPFTIIAAGFGTVIAPTGDPGATGIVALIVTGLLTQAVTLLIQSMALIVQATAAALIYIDCRMRREGLDLDLLAYVERRDAGASGLPDPYTQGVGRSFVRPAPVGVPYGAAAYGPPAGYPHLPQNTPVAYGAPAGPGAYAPAPGGHPPAPSAYPQTPGGFAPPPAAPPYAAYPPPPGATPAPPAPQAPAETGAPAPDPNAPQPTQWAAPGRPAGDADREHPWS